MDIKHKIDNLKERSNLEKIILELSEMKKSKEVDDKISELKEELSTTINKFNRSNELYKHNNKLYLSEIIEKEKPKFGSNNLILAPVGSGKTALINKYLLSGYTGKAIHLVSTRYLKEDII